MHQDVPAVQLGGAAGPCPVHGTGVHSQAGRRQGTGAMGLSADADRRQRAGPAGRTVPQGPSYRVPLGMLELQPYQQQPHLRNRGIWAILHLEGQERVRQGCEDGVWGVEGGVKVEQDQRNGAKKARWGVIEDFERCHGEQKARL